MSEREREKTDSNMSRVEISRAACMRQIAVGFGGGGSEGPGVVLYPLCQ